MPRRLPINRATMKPPGWRGKLYDIIFEADTPIGKAFDVALIGVIVLSVIAVMLESVAEIRAEYGALLYTLEWIFTIIFTIEYILRLVCVRRPLRYATSTLGIIDLLATIPTYLSVFVPGAQFLLSIRLLRILRVFRVLKMTHYLTEAGVLVQALRDSRRKITIFIFSVVTLVIVLGSLMYLIEGPEHGFDSIPRSVYWAIVTLTTVGYGDISPETNLGQFLASVIMILGYGIIAVPTGIVTAELTQQTTKQHEARAALASQIRCPNCTRSGHAEDAAFCKYCGHSLRRRDL